jgi:hypothetical protein
MAQSCDDILATDVPRESNFFCETHAIDADGCLQKSDRQQA